VAQIYPGAGRFERGAGEPHWVEHGRSAHLSVGTYSVAVGQPDSQGPHREDEVYVVMAGRARFSAPGIDAEVGPGTTIFVGAGEEHRFSDVVSDLSCLVIFAPPETGP